MSESMKLLVGLHGASIEIDAIRLHNQHAVKAWQTEFSEAQALLGEFSTGLGSIGSLGFVVTSALTLGIIERLVTKSSQRVGIEKLAQAMARYRTLASRGTYVAVEEVVNIEIPDPTQWEAFGEVTTEAQLTGLPERQLAHYIEEFGVTDEEIFQGFALRVLPKPLSILPGEFVNVRSAGREIFIRWVDISSYELKRG